MKLRHLLLLLLAPPLSLLAQGSLIVPADRVIAMGGYNTVCEVLSFEKRALIIPRVKPRREQIIRAERLRDLGLIDMLHPDDLNSPALSEWMRRDLPAIKVDGRINLNGLDQLPTLAKELLATPRPGDLAS